MQGKFVHEMKKFTEKACTRKTNKKLPFGTAEVKKLWDKIDHMHGTIENLSVKDLRTFMLAVFQHKTMFFMRLITLRSISASLKLTSRVRDSGYIAKVCLFVMLTC
jgi:hypothetical protein